MQRGLTSPWRGRWNAWAYAHASDDVGADEPQRPVAAAAGTRRKLAHHALQVARADGHRPGSTAPCAWLTPTGWSEEGVEHGGFEPPSPCLPARGITYFGLFWAVLPSCREFRSFRPVAPLGASLTPAWRSVWRSASAAASTTGRSRFDWIRAHTSGLDEPAIGRRGALAPLTTRARRLPRKGHVREPAGRYAGGHRARTPRSAGPHRALR